MQYKTRDVYEGYFDSHVILREVISWIDNYYYLIFNVEALMTGSHRSHAKSIELYAGKQINPKTNAFYTPEEVPVSVHETSPLRGIDLRSRILNEAQNNILVKAINDEWVYDRRREHLKVATLHKVGDNAFHLHIQVNNKTEKRQAHEMV